MSHPFQPTGYVVEITVPPHSASRFAVRAADPAYAKKLARAYHDADENQPAVIVETLTQADVEGYGLEPDAVISI